MLDTKEKVETLQDIFTELASVHEGLQHLAEIDQFRTDNEEWQWLDNRQTELLTEASEILDAK